MTIACCCGTTRIACMTTMIATTNSRTVISDEPTSLAEFAKGISDRRTLVGEHQYRAARGDDVEGLGAGNRRRFELGIPRRTAIRDACGAVGIPRCDAHRLSQIERR